MVGYVGLELICLVMKCMAYGRLCWFRIDMLGELICLVMKCMAYGRLCWFRIDMLGDEVYGVW